MEKIKDRYNITLQTLSTLKEVLDKFESGSVPEEYIREALNANLISAKDAPILMDCITSRNETSHTYNEFLAQQVVDDIPDYYEVMHKIMKTIPIAEI